MSASYTILNGEIDLIGTLGAELIRVRALNKQILRKAEDLRKEIGAYEARLEQAGLASLEAENIARGIDEEAQSRVQSIVENAQQAVKPLYERISNLEQEIVTLAQEIDLREEQDDTTEVEEVAVVGAFEASTPESWPEVQPSSEKSSEQTCSQGEDLDLVELPSVTSASLPSSQADELSVESLRDLAAAEPDMHFVVFVDARHFETGAGQTEPIHSHGWQIEIEVGVRDNGHYYGGYSKVSQAIDSTILRYDGEILNDVFPFTLLDPSLSNVAMYFFNCLDNMLSLIDLVIKEVTVWEDSDSCIKVTTRNAELDDLLNKGEDFLEDFRSRLCADDQGKKASTSLVRKLEQMFKLPGWSSTVKN